MKRRLATLILFLTLLSGSVIADNWTPGTPKPIETPDAWFVGVTGFFGDLWTYFMY